MPVINREVVLSHSCLSVVAESMQLRLPPHLLTEPVAYDDGEWEQLLQATHHELANVGLSARGELTAAMEDTMSVLCGGDTEFHGLVTATQREYYLHVTARGSHAVFAALANGNVILRPAKADALVSELLAELPEARPAQGRSLSASQAEMAPSDGGRVHNNTAPRGDARRLLELFDRPRAATTHFGVAARVGIDARKVTSNTPVSLFDLDEGRWLAYASDNGADRHYAATPGRTDTVARTLQEVQQSLLAGQR